MEPVTHFLTGACIGRAGFNRKTAYATLVAVLAAEAADLDILWGFAGPVKELQHHRGITHTFWAVPVIAGVIIGAVWLVDRTHLAVARRRSRALHNIARAGALKGHDFNRAVSRKKNEEALAPEGQAQADPPSFPSIQEMSEAKSPNPASGDLQNPKRSRAQGISIYEVAPVQKESTRDIPAEPAPRQPIRWGWLYLTACTAALSHLLLDWTNNYGLRPFFPFNPRWYAGSFMFIAEPVVWALFFLALFMPWVLGLADREIGARRKPFRGRGWAIFALIGFLIYGGWRWSEHAQARALLENIQLTSDPPLRMAFEPYPINPFRWHAIVETADFYQTAEIDTRTGSIDSDPAQDVIYKPADTPAVEAAKRTPLGQVYLDWGTWAVVRDVGQEPVAGMDPPSLPPGRNWTTVEFSDLRFGYNFLPGRASHGAGDRATLAGWVYIVDGRDDAGEAMNGREQR
jgi:inner membrane protein